MITKNNKLQVFENFNIDYSLRKSQNNDSFTMNEVNPTGGIWLNPNSSVGVNGFVQDDSDEFRLITEYLQYKYSQNATIINWVKLKLGKLFMSNKVEKKHIKYISIEEFFKNVKSAVLELNLSPNSVDFYTSAIQVAVDNGQQALSEILASKKNVVLKEINLLQHGSIKYVTEEDVVNFFNKSKVSDKFLKLSWMKNYLRVIPDNVLEEKRKYDKFECFDNYVILHFDVNDDSTQLTKKEIEKAKDPILFGVISGSRKLYFIGDWIDEYCDLTLDKFIKTLEQKKVKELTKASLKKEILNQK